MFYLQGQNANGSVIAVTSTATRLFDLINTAASTTLDRAGYSFKANGVNIRPEDGDIRVTFSEGISPTSTKGELLVRGMQYFFRNVPLDKMKLIRTGSSNVNCSIAVGVCDPGEATAAAGSGSGGLTDGATFGVASDSVTPIGLLVDEVATGTVGEGLIGAQRMSARRAGYVSMDTTISGEDQTINVLKVEERFTAQSSVKVDTQVKASAGFLHSATFSCDDAVPTAGSIIIYNNTAESGVQIFNHTFTVTPFVPFTVIFDVEMTDGIYIGFTTTGDVNVGLSYR